MRAIILKLKAWRYNMGKGVRVKIDKDKLIQIYQPRFERGMGLACEWTVAFVKESFQEGASGRAYPRGDKIHHASKPGETPAVDTSHLRDNIKYVVHVNGLDVIGKVGTNVKYGYWLEFGTAYTDDEGKRKGMEERPFLRPAVYNNKPQINKQFVLGARL